MRTHLFRFALYSIFVCFSFAAPNLAMASSPPSAGDEGRVCGVIDWQPDNRRYARTLANLDIGEPRTVRLIYFLPNDQYFRPEVVQRMKDEIRRIQAFFAEQMGAHGYGEKTFSIETDPQGDPLVHRVNGQQPNWYYHSDVAGNTLSEIEQVFDLNANIYLIVFDNHRERIGSLFGVLGYGIRYNKNAGYALLPGEFTFETTAHELGHAFGLQHDFHDNAYIMSYGPGERRLSACSAEFLVVHPYFNPDVPIVDSSYSTMELISSPQYPPGAASVSVQLGVSAPDGLHQILLFARTEKPHEAARFLEIVSCHGLMGEKNAVAQFDYDGIKPSRGLGSLADSAIHTIFVNIVDIHGDVTKRNFRLFETFSGHIDTIHAPEPLSSEWHDLSFSPDGSLLALGAILLDVKTGTTIAVFEDVTSIAFSPDEKILASGSFNFWVKLWDVATQTNIVTLEGHQPTVGPVAFSLDGKILAAGSGDTTIKLWDVETRTNIATLEGHEHKIRSVVFSPDGKTLASGSIDSTVRLWDVESQTNTATLEGHYGWVTSVVFSPDGMTLASAGDKTIKLWNVETEKMTATLGGHKAFVESVAFSPDGLVLASGSADATVKLWDMMSWANFATLVHPEWVKSVAFSSDGTTLASATQNYTVELWNTSEWVRLRNQAVPDPNLRTTLQIALGKEAGTPITPMDLASLANFLAPEASMTALVGLEFATNLESLSVYENSISSLAPLAELINLKSLSLGKNNITDILPLAGLTNLIDLSLHNNNISDLSHLQGLINLTSLALGYNSISDISVLSGLTSLVNLYLAGNKISDISILSNLTNLTVLHLAVNSISDISPLVANTGLGEGDRLFLKRNPLSYDAINTHIPILQGRGVTVSFNDRTPTTLQIISGDDQVGFLSEPPANPFVVEVRDEHGAVFEGVPVTFAIADGGGMLRFC